MRDRASQQAALAGLGQAGAVGSGFRRAARGRGRRGRARAGGGPRGGARAHPRRRRACWPGPASGCRTACSAACCPVEPGRLARDLGAASSLAADVGQPLRRDRGPQPPRTTTSRRTDAEFLTGVAGVLGAAGERAGHEDLVRDSEAQFRELADTTPALMWMTDAEGDVTFVNEGWRRFTGGTETAGVTFASSAHPDDREETVRLWREAMSRREEFRCEYRLRHAASGGYRWVLELGTPRCSERRVRGLRGHRHGHPRAAHDGGGAARVGGELPRARRHGPGDDVDHRHGRR